jgi:hypothetical protein
MVLTVYASEQNEDRWNQGARQSQQRQGSWPSLTALLIATLVSTLFGLLVLVIEIASGQPNGASDGSTEGGVASNRTERRSAGSAHGASAQSSLLGVRHARASTERKADNQNGRH